VQQVSYGPHIMSIMLIMSCYTGFFNVRRGWQSLNTGPQFYLHLIRRTGWLWIYTSCTTDERPFKPKKLSVPFLYSGVPVGLTPFRGLGRRNLVPILPPRHTLWEGGGGRKLKKDKQYNGKKRTKGQILIYKALHRNLKINQSTNASSKSEQV
jgi:hypothetical protein